MNFFYTFIHKTIDYLPLRFAFVSKPVENSPLEIVTELPKDFQDDVEIVGVKTDFDTAKSLMDNQAYQDCIEVYSMLAQKYPHTVALCENQIAAAYFFLRRYEQALDFYVRSRHNGMDNEIIDDNIWKVCFVQYQENKLKDFLKTYIKLCPSGKYVNDAEFVLQLK